MGIHNREYMRDDSGPGRKWDGVTTLLALNCVMFIVQILTHNPLADRAPVERWLALNPHDLFGGQVWRLVTYQFLHDVKNILHIVFNMFILYWAGRRIEDRYGKREFLLFYFVAGVVAGICQIAFQLLLHKNQNTLGASGAITAVMLLFVMHHPHEEMLLFGLIRMRAYVLLLITIAYDVFHVVQEFAGGRTDDVAHIAHLGGTVFGYLYWRNGWELSRLISFRRRPQLRAYTEPTESRPIRPIPDAPRLRDPQPDPVDLEARVDAVLKKVFDHGESSLSSDERAVLQEASRRYKNRR